MAHYRDSGSLLCNRGGSRSSSPARGSVTLADQGSSLQSLPDRLQVAPTQNLPLGSASAFGLSPSRPVQGSTIKWRSYLSMPDPSRRGHGHKLSNLEPLEVPYSFPTLNFAPVSHRTKGASLREWEHSSPPSSRVARVSATQRGMPGLFQRAIARTRFRSRHGEVWFHPAPEPLKLHTGILKGKDIPIIMGSLPTIFSDRGVPFHMNSEAHAFVFLIYHIYQRNRKYRTIAKFRAGLKAATKKWLFTWI